MLMDVVFSICGIPVWLKNYTMIVCPNIRFLRLFQQSYEFTPISGIFVLFGIFRSFRFVVFLFGFEHYF